jgi:Zn-dependent protease with chaperone function/Zn-finger nucleic acid-binding protein
MEQVRADDPDPDDGVHRRLMNVMDEILIASGGRKRISCKVIPTLSLNALAVTDLKGGAVIAISEGLLSRLTRPQIEAVMAHEAYHVLSGDCLEASLATSLFGMYASAVEKLNAVVREDIRAFPVFMLFWLLHKLGAIVSMFISREREYRADAGAVRMTRNPLALAEALNLISGRWTGAGFISDGLEMLCISSPDADIHDESEGWWDDLLSTHPPIRKRIDVLLMMAHASASVLEKNGRTRRPAEAAEEALYFAHDPENLWQGPFRLSELATFAWFSPLTWITKELGGAPERAASIQSLNGLFRGRITGDGAGGMRCPVCRQPLVPESYELTTVNRCFFCHGVLVDNEKIPRILARSETECTERLRSLIHAVTADHQRSLAIRKSRVKERNAEEATRCPKCGREMFRTFYSYAFLVELDKCGICRMTWFDPDELEMLQCLVENRITGAIGIETAENA